MPVFQVAGPAGVIPFRQPEGADPRGWEGLGKGIAALKQLENQDLFRIIEGVKAGLIDPDQALTQGTKGGSAFEKYFGVKPPSAPQPEMVDTTQFPRNMDAEREAQEPMPYDPSRENLGTGGGIPLTAPTGRMKGGFLPNTNAQLKDWVSRKLAKGEEVSPQLMQAAGLQPKSLAALAATDPEAAANIQRLRNNPAQMRAFTQMKIAFPDASDDEIAKFVLGASGGVGGGANLGVSQQQQKVKAIGEYKNRELLARTQHWQELIRTRDRRLDNEEQQFLLKTTGSLLDRLSRHIGFDYAKDVVAALANGENLDEIPLPEEVKKRVMADFSRKQQVADAKTLTANAAMLRATTQANVAPAKLEADVQRFNAMYEIMTQNANDRNLNNYVKNNLSVAFKQMQIPATSAEGQKNLLDIVQNQLGWEVEGPEGFQAVKEWVGRLFGTPGLGNPTIKAPAGPQETQPAVKPAPRTAPQLRNPPRIVPSRPNTGAPKTADEFLNRYRGGIQPNTAPRQP